MISQLSRARHLVNRPAPVPSIGTAARPDGERVERVVALAFAPMHKEALGVALGLVLGLIVALATVAGLALDPEGRVPLELLAQYFAGYERSITGAFIGLAWGLFVGFIAGWFLAFLRNLFLATWLLVIRARVEWAATRDFLDHM